MESWEGVGNGKRLEIIHTGHPRSQSVTADTALPKVLTKTKTKSYLIDRMKTMESGN
jgi:hypothetical protein